MRREPDTWEGLMGPMGVASDKLDQSWALVSHLENVRSTPEIRSLHEELQPKVMALATEIAQSPARVGRGVRAASLTPPTRRLPSAPSGCCSGRS